MLSVLSILGLFVLAWPVARRASRLPTRHHHRRKAERRARYVARNPHEVDLGDIRLMLRRGGLSADQIDFVATRATEMGIRPFTMLVWLKRFDAPALATAIAADLSHDDLIAHVSNGTVPDLDGLAIFAELNGFGLVPVPTKSVRRSRPARQHPAPRRGGGADTKKWAMENGVPVTMETLGMYDEIVPNDERPPGRDEFGAA